MEVHQKAGNIHELRPAEGVPVRFYPNGIFVRRGPFRSYQMDSACQFVRDIIAGFLPAEWQKEFPEGVQIQASFE